MYKINKKIKISGLDEKYSFDISLNIRTKKLMVGLYFYDIYQRGYSKSIYLETLEPYEIEKNIDFFTKIMVENYETEKAIKDKINDGLDSSYKE